MVKKNIPVSLIIASVLFITSCSNETVAEEETATSTPSGTTETVDTETEAETVEETDEEAELTYEENTAEIINAIVNAFKTSTEQQTSNGFMEYTEGVIKSESKNYQTLLIETITAPEYIYYFNSMMGFSTVTELFKGEVAAEYKLSPINTTFSIFVDNTETSDPTALKKIATFKKESPTGIYIIESDEIFFTPATMRIEINNNGLITSTTLATEFNEETTTYQYGYTTAIQKYIEESFKPTRTQPEEEPVELEE